MMVVRAKGLEKAVEDFEERADNLIAEIGEQREIRVYTEAGLLRKMRREQTRPVERRESMLPDDAYDYLLLAYIRDLIASPQLTSQERLALILSTTGWRQSDAAILIGVRRARYQRIMRSARKKVERYASNPYAGWYEVYLSEVNRYVYRKHHRGNKMSEGE